MQKIVANCVGLNPNVCALTGHSAWGKPNIRFDFGGGLHAYILATAWNFLDENARGNVVIELRKQADSIVNLQVDKKEVKK